LYLGYIELFQKTIDLKIKVKYHFMSPMVRAQPSLAAIIISVHDGTPYISSCYIIYRFCHSYLGLGYALWVISGPAIGVL